MKNKIDLMIKTIKRTLTLSAWLLIIFTAINEINLSGQLVLESYGYTKRALGYVAVGLGYGLPGFIYGCEKLSMKMKMLIQLSIGGLVTVIIGFLMGWIPQDNALKTILWLVLSIGLSIIIAFCDYYFLKKKWERQMNERIRQMQQ